GVDEQHRCYKFPVPERAHRLTIEQCRPLNFLISSLPHLVSERIHSDIDSRNFLDQMCLGRGANEDQLRDELRRLRVASEQNFHDDADDDEKKEENRAFTAEEFESADPDWVQPSRETYEY